MNYDSNFNNEQSPENNPGCEFKPMLFWDNIIQPKKHRALYFKLLRSEFANALASLVPDIDITKPNRFKLQRIKEQNRKATKFIDMALNANAVLIHCSSLYRKNTERGIKYVTDEELDNEKLTFDVFKKALLQISQFIAFMYDMSVPDSIREFCAGVDDKGPDIPYEEIQKLNLDYLTKNYGCDLFPCAIVLDNGMSMAVSGQIENLENGFNDLFEEIIRDKHLKQRMQLFLTTTGNGPKIVLPFGNVANQIGFLQSYSFSPFGACNIAATLDNAMDAIEQRCDEICKAGSRFFTPWLIILSNGKWQDSKNKNLPEVAMRLRKLADTGKIQLYVRSISPINEKQLENLRKLSNDVEQLTDVAGFFRDVYASLHSSKNSSAGGQKVQLVNRHGFN